MQRQPGGGHALHRHHQQHRGTVALDGRPRRIAEDHFGQQPCQRRQQQAGHQRQQHGNTQRQRREREGFHGTTAWRPTPRQALIGFRPRGGGLERRTRYARPMNVMLCGDFDAAEAQFQTPHQRTLARRAAAESAVLLANDGVLPLGPGLRRVAVIGPGADDRRLLQGDYHYPAHQEIIYLAPKREADPNMIGAEDFTPQAGGAFAPGPYYTPHVTPLAGLLSLIHI